MREDLGNPDQSVRRAALGRVVQLQRLPPDLLEDVVALLADPQLRYAAIAALGRRGTEAVPALIAALGKPSLEPYAREALRSLGEPILANVVRIVRSDDATTQRLAIRGLLELGPSAAHGLVQLAADTAMRPAVAEGLARLPRAYMPALLDALNHTTDDVRRFAVPLMWRSRTESWRAKVLELAPGLATPATRDSTALSLAAFGPSALDDILALLRVSKFREGVVYALGLMGPKVLTRLQQARATESDPNTRAAIEDAIRQIER